MYSICLTGRCHCASFIIQEAGPGCDAGKSEDNFRMSCSAAHSCLTGAEGYQRSCMSGCPAIKRLLHLRPFHFSLCSVDLPHRIYNQSEKTPAAINVSNYLQHSLQAVSVKISSQFSRKECTPKLLLLERTASVNGSALRASALGLK